MRPIKKAIFEDGSYIEDPSFVDYGDGVGVQIEGGELYDKDGRHIGHADPPGPRGTSGLPSVPIPRVCVKYWLHHYGPASIRHFLHENGHVCFDPRGTEGQAEEMCRLYIESRPKEEWPTLLGVNPIMDKILGEKFKWCGG